MALLNEGIEVDHLCMCMEGFKYSRARYPLRERSYSCVYGSFRHDEPGNDENDDGYSKYCGSLPHRIFRS